MIKGGGGKGWDNNGGKRKRVNGGMGRDEISMERGGGLVWERVWREGILRVMKMRGIGWRR